MPEWLYTLLGLVGGTFGLGVLAWVKFFRSEAPLSDAQRRSLEADVRVKEAQAAETVGVVLGNALDKVSDLAEKRRLEIVQLETRVDELDGRVDFLEDDRRDQRHWLSARGEHGGWDQDAKTLARQVEPDFPDPPALPDDLA